jgi:hypothetical protein
VIAPEDCLSAPWAGAFSIHLQVLSEREHFPELEKPMREHLCVGDDRTELFRRYLLHSKERAGPRAKQHLVLDDVADAGEDRLVEQHIRDLAMRECADLFQRGSRIPSIRHDVGSEVVLGPDVGAFYPFHGRCPDGNFAIRQVHHQTRWAGASVVAGNGFPFHRRCERTPQHEMDPHGKRVELEDEMFPPGEDVLDLFAAKPVDAYPAVPTDTGDSLPDKRPQLLRREMDGGAFHACVSLQGLRLPGHPLNLSLGDLRWHRGLEYSASAQGEFFHRRLATGALRLAAERRRDQLIVLPGARAGNLRALGRVGAGVVPICR